MVGEADECLLVATKSFPVKFRDMDESNLGIINTSYD